MAIRKVKPVVAEWVEGASLACGAYCAYGGQFYLHLGDGLLHGPVGTALVQLPVGTLVQRVRLCDENGNWLS